MTQVSVVMPAGGEAIQLGPVRLRILEDGRTTDHRLGIARHPGHGPARRPAYLRQPGR